jgi:putative ATP-dependent endonuclease of OLD family
MASLASTRLVDRVLISEVRIQDFRALRDVHISLSRLTVLVGENNVGKTSLLEGLEIAIGGARAMEEDLYLGPDEVRAPRFVIDIRVVPSSGNEFDDVIRERIGAAVRLPAGGSEYFAIRTVGEPSPDGSGLAIERHFLADWAPNRVEAERIQLLERPNRRQLDLLDF